MRSTGILHYAATFLCPALRSSAAGIGTACHANSGDSGRSRRNLQAGITVMVPLFRPNSAMASLSAAASRLFHLQIKRSTTPPKPSHYKGEGRVWLWFVDLESKLEHGGEIDLEIKLHATMPGTNRTIIAPIHFAAAVNENPGFRRRRTQR